VGKSSKARKHNEKMKRKRAEKAAKRAQYAALAGTSKKSKKINRRARSTVSGTYKGAHIMSDCGNPGCKRCYPKLNGVLPPQ
jgi:hypothetical protein